MLGKLLVVTALLAPISSPALARDWDDCLDIRSARDTAYVITDGEHQTLCGEIRDLPLPPTAGVPRDSAVYFRLDEQTWVVRDPAVVAEARRLFRKVGAIGEQQGAIGAKQGAIGAEQGKIGVQQANLALSRLGSSNAPEDDARAAAERDARMRDLGEHMEVLSRQQSALAGEMKRELARAQAGLSTLLGKAIQDGKAVPIRRL